MRWPNGRVIDREHSGGLEVDEVEHALTDQEVANVSFEDFGNIR